MYRYVKLATSEWDPSFGYNELEANVGKALSSSFINLITYYVWASRTRNWLVLPRARYPSCDGSAHTVIFISNLYILILLNIRFNIWLVSRWGRREWVRILDRIPPTDMSAIVFGRRPMYTCYIYLNMTVAYDIVGGGCHDRSRLQH